MHDPRTQRSIARAEKELEKLARDLDREPPNPGLDDEDAPLLDPDDPATQQAREAMGLAGQLQASMREMLPNLAAKMQDCMIGLGPAAIDLGQRGPYPHVQPLIEELSRYAAAGAGS